MKKFFLTLVISSIVFSSFAQKDKPDCMDKTFSFFTIFDGYYLQSCEFSEYGSYKFVLDQGYTPVTKEGVYRMVEIHKKADTNRMISGLQIIRNHINAIKAVGGEVTEDTEEHIFKSVFKTTYNGKELWIFVAVGNLTDVEYYRIYSIEVDVMKQEIATQGIKGTAPAIVATDTQSQQALPEPQEPDLPAAAQSDPGNVGLPFAINSPDSVGLHGIAAPPSGIAPPVNVAVNEDNITNTATGFETLLRNTSGNNNSAYGYKALYSNTTGANNLASGSLALYFNTSGNKNTASGFQALLNNTTGNANTANGYQALSSNTTGTNNTANGYQTLSSNTTGEMNTASGYQALSSNTTGIANTANGYQALYYNTTGYNNTAIGIQALAVNTAGSSNTASGYLALRQNTVGCGNTASGFQALFRNITGYSNTASGYQALGSSTTGDANTAFGHLALSNNTTGTGNTAIGNYTLNSNKMGDHNTAIGYGADIVDYHMGESINNATAIGFGAIVNNSNKVRIGNTDITAIEGQVPMTITSDRRLKEDIQTTSLGLDFINDLNPALYHRINNESPDMEMGIIGQELKAVLEKYHASDLGIVNQVGDDYMTVRYNDLFAPLIKAVQELSAENTALKSEVAEIAKLKAELAEFKALILTTKDR